MNRHVALIALLGLLPLSCGPGSSGGTATMPTLPGDGSENTAAPTAPADDAAGADPWAGRDDLIAAPAAQPPAELTLPPIERFTLSNGLEVVIVANHDLPVVGFQLAIKTGRADEARDKRGLSRFVAAMLTSGTRKRKAAVIAETIDMVGGSLGADATYEATLVSCQVLAKDTKVCLDLVPDIVVNPTFPEDEMKTVRDALMQIVRGRLDDAGQLADVHIQNALWGDEHVRGWPMTGRTISSIKRADLVKWHKDNFKPNNAILAIAGDVDPKVMRKELERSFRTWRKGKVTSRATYEAPKPSGIRIRLVDKPGQTQSNIRIAHLGVSHSDADYVPTEVMNYSLGGGAFSARLMKVVRSKGGKSYGAWSRFDRNFDRGAFVAGTATRTSETAVTTQLILDELGKMQDAGPTDKEVSDAKANLAGSYATRFESASDIAGALLGALLHGLDEQYLKSYALKVGAVTVEDARNAAQDHLDADNLAIVIVGEAKEIIPQLEAKGWAYTTVAFNDPITAYEREAVIAERTGPVSAAEAKKARKLLDAALAAKGGKKRLSKIKSVRFEGDAKVTAGPQKFDAKVTRTWISPGSILFVMQIDAVGVRIVSAITPETAWQQQTQGDQQVVQELSGPELEEAKRQAWRDAEFILMRHLDKGTNVRPLPDETVDGKSYHVVSLARADGSAAVKLYIARDTKMLAAMTYEDGAGGVALEAYRNYKKVDGIQIAHSRSLQGPSVAFSLSFTAVEINGKVDPKVFDKPQANK